MSEPVTYFWVALAAIIILVDLWAIVSVFRSDKTDSTKAIQQADVPRVGGYRLKACPMASMSCSRAQGLKRKMVRGSSPSVSKLKPDVKIQGKSGHFCWIMERNSIPLMLPGSPWSAMAREKLPCCSNNSMSASSALSNMVQSLPNSRMISDINVLNV